MTKASVKNKCIKVGIDLPHLLKRYKVKNLTELATKEPEAYHELCNFLAKI